MASIKPYLRFYKESNSHIINLIIRDDFGGASYKSLKIKIDPANWSGEKVINHPNALRYNSIISAEKNKLDKIISIAEINSTKLNIKEILGSKKIFDENSLFVDYANLHLKNRTIEIDTFRRYKKAFYYLELFNKNTRLKDFTPEFVLQFQKFLIETPFNKGETFKTNYVLKVLACVRTFVKIAFNDGILKKYAFGLVTLKSKEETYREHLNLDIVEQIRSVNLMRYPGVNHARKLFLFQCNTGMAYADVMKLKKTDLVDGRLNQIKRKKSKVMNTILLTDEALQIADELKTDSEFLFKRISNKTYNLHLKTLAKLANIDVNLTTHVARHTFATIMLNKGVPLKALSALLSHKRISTTEIYAKIVDKTKDEAIRILEKAYKAEKNELKTG